MLACGRQLQDLSDAICVYVESFDAFGTGFKQRAADRFAVVQCFLDAFCKEFWCKDVEVEGEVFLPDQCHEAQQFALGVQSDRWGWRESGQDCGMHSGGDEGFQAFCGSFENPCGDHGARCEDGGQFLFDAFVEFRGGVVVFGWCAVHGHVGGKYDDANFAFFGNLCEGFHENVYMVAAGYAGFG